MKYKFLNTAGVDTPEVQAVPEPKYVWVDVQYVHVYTGEDIPVLE